MNQKSRQDIFDIIDACADQLEHLNQAFPGLASDDTHTAVKNWRQRRGEIRLQVKEVQKGHGVEIVQNVDVVQDLDQLCAELLETHGLEDASDILLEKHGIDISVHELIKNVGKEAYIAAMRKEVTFLRENGVAFDQIASLWNELGRPGPGSGPWTEPSVSLLGR